MDLKFSRDECLNLENSLKSEWLETNGLGGYASSTIVDCHTRKYHGLLVAPLEKQNGKFVLLSRLDPVIHVNDHTFQLSTNKFPEVFHPTGHKYINFFECLTHPRTAYHIGDIELERSVLMPQGENTVIVEFKLKSADKPITFNLNPKLAYRSIHALTRENMFLRVKTYVRDGVYIVDPYEGMPALYMDTSLTTEFFPGPYWMRNVEYLKERSRGFDYQEDLFCPGVIECTLKKGDVLYFRASIMPPKVPVVQAWKAELARRTQEWKAIKEKDLAVKALKYHASQLIIQNALNKPSIVAGYHWFDEWGRDAMIAVPGLTWECGKPELGRDILKTFAEFEKNGLIPNFISVNGKDIAYNSVDASLWFCWAVQEYLKKTGDNSTVKRVFLPVIKKILMSFANHKLEHVNAHENGLIWVGNPHTQLTWMDAKVHGQPVTPRHGYAVEINALWFNALSFYKELCAQFKLECDWSLEKSLNALTQNFSLVFWCEELGCLADVVNEKGKDLSIRPNQIFAASLPYSPLSQMQQRKVIACVEKNLLTSCGLRTLSPRSDGYKAEYHGSPADRDAAYHQGTVWAWLVGHFTEASLKHTKTPEETRKHLLEGYQNFLKQHLETAGVGCVSEIFNGDPPHTAKGCIHQAWSVAEIIRGWGLLQGSAFAKATADKQVSRVRKVKQKTEKKIAQKKKVVKKVLKKAKPNKKGRKVK